MLSTQICIYLLFRVRSKNYISLVDRHLKSPTSTSFSLSTSFFSMQLKKGNGPRTDQIFFFYYNVFWITNWEQKFRRYIIQMKKLKNSFFLFFLSFAVKRGQEVYQLFQFKGENRCWNFLMPIEVLPNFRSTLGENNH